MIIDARQECIVLLDEDYRDLRYVAQAMSASSQEIAKFFHKSGMIFMEKVKEQIKEAEYEVKV